MNNTPASNTKSEKPYRCVIEIDDENVDKAFDLYYELLHNASSGKQTSSTSLKKFFKLLHIDSKYTEKRLQMLSICKKVTDRFNNAEYERHFKSESFNKFIRRIVGQIIFSDYIPKRKEHFVTFVFDLIKEWKHRWEKKKAPMSEYKQMVLTAFITIQFEFSLTLKKDPSNEELYQSVRHAISKSKS
jgi:hypothetical protein